MRSEGFRRRLAGSPRWFAEGLRRFAEGLRRFAGGFPWFVEGFRRFVGGAGPAEAAAFAPAVCVEAAAEGRGTAASPGRGPLPPALYRSGKL